MVPLKRRKLSDTGKSGTNTSGGTEPSKFPRVVLFLLERKMGASRRAFLSQLARKKGFQVEELLSEKVTHVVCENVSGEDGRAWLRSQGGSRPPPHLLDVSWFTDSMRAGRPVEVLDRHQLQNPNVSLCPQELQAGEPEVEVFSVPSYACQRRTSLENHNAPLTDALSLLAENAELNDEEGRGVAFRRAAALLKTLPSAVMSASQLRGLPCLGEHSLREILETGTSTEVESTKGSERFKALKVLTGIFGVGAKTADRWIREGIHDLHQLRASGQHYADINQPVTRAEADAIEAIVEKAVSSVLRGAQIVLTGGFRRGKPSGHDVDFLITHPEEGREEGLMPKVVSWLEKTTRNSYLESKDGPGRPPSNMDRFERCLSIFKLPGAAETPQRAWRAVRVDLVVSPISQFAFALLGWTGSKLFERELRRWAGHERGMSLSSHALYDNKQVNEGAASEEEIFAHLGLEFVPPSERNA
uniref:DNA-directed DNA/RNA polymerase mu n=1 Tax=Oryzias latipes TaxID=8090 RepID=H2L5F7_ORYLA